MARSRGELPIASPGHRTEPSRVIHGAWPRTRPCRRPPRTPERERSSPATSTARRRRLGALTRQTAETGKKTYTTGCTGGAGRPSPGHSGRRSRWRRGRGGPAGQRRCWAQSRERGRAIQKSLVPFSIMTFRSIASFSVDTDELPVRPAQGLRVH
jgi:hypothetical protein